MIKHNIKQGSEEWYAIRQGIITASEFSKLLSPLKSQSTQIEVVSMVLAAERIGVKKEGFRSKYMEAGNEKEAIARVEYEFKTGVEVKQVGFITDDQKTCGYSPDGLVGKDGLIEIKCPKLETILKVIGDGKAPLDYKPQIQGGLMITGRKWCDLVFYYPDLPLFIERQFRDEDYILKLQEQIILVNKMADDFYQKHFAEKEVELKSEVVKTEPKEIEIEF